MKKVRTIDHQGRYYKTSSPFIVRPSAQRTPLLFQAGASSAGTQFAAKHAEAVFLTSVSAKLLRSKVDKIRGLARGAGRDPTSVKIFGSFTPTLGRTDSEAEERFQELKKYASEVGAFVLFGGWTGIDLSKIPAYQNLTVADSKYLHRIQALLDELKATSPEVPEWTARAVADKVAFGGLGPLWVGSPTTVVDKLES